MTPLLLSIQNTPFIVTVIDKPSPQTTLFDVILGALGLTGVLVLIALLAGGVTAFALVKWHQRHRPEQDHLPSLTN
jgi:hypothetical protein